MTKPITRRVALRHLGVVGRTAARVKTAGEVRFIKDRGSDKSEWGWGSPGPSERKITDGFVFNAKYLKPLACTMRSALMALGHATSAHSRFVKIKSRNISPDGALGGQGYIAKIPDMRRQLMNVIEALSAFTDTVYDEMEAPHWNQAEDTLTPRDRDDVKEIVEDVKEIKEDPEGWAREEEKEMDEEDKGKKASRAKTASTSHLATWNHGHDALVADVTYNEIAAIPDQGLGKAMRQAALEQDASVLSRKGNEYAGTFVLAADLQGNMFVDFVHRRPDAGRVALRYLETP